MFQVVPQSQRTFTRDVTVRSPANGGHTEETVNVTYNYLDVDHARRFDLSTPTGTDDFLRAVVRRLDDLVDSEKRPLPYNDELRDHVIRQPAARQAICAAYFEAVAGAASGN